MNAPFIERRERRELPEQIEVKIEKLLRGGPVVLYQHDGGRSLGPFRRKHRAPFVVLRARSRALTWPSNIIGAPRPGDRRTPVERWQDWCFEWEGHFYG